MTPIDTIKSSSPKAYVYFKEYYENEYEFKIGGDFEILPFDFQLGVFVQFFDSISSDVQLYSTTRDALIDSITEAFETYEEYLFLDIKKTIFLSTWCHL